MESVRLSDLSRNRRSALGHDVEILMLRLAHTSIASRLSTAEECRLEP